MRTIIERGEDSELCSGVKQTFTFGIFAHGVHVGAVWNSVHDRAPAFPQIGRLEDVWLKIVEFMSIHRHISRVAVVRRRFDEIDSTQVRHFRCDVRPMLTVICRDLDETIVCARPDGSFCYWRFSERKHGVVIFD